MWFSVTLKMFGCGGRRQPCQSGRLRRRLFVSGDHSGRTSAVQTILGHKERTGI